MADQPTSDRNTDKPKQTGAAARTSNPPPLLSAPNFTLQSSNSHRDSSVLIAKKEEPQQIYRKYLQLCEGEKILVNQLKTVKQETEKLYEVYGSMMTPRYPQREKRLRRRTEQIERTHSCPLEGCLKKYGLVGSVVQHIKLKHPDFHNSPHFHTLFNSKTRKEPKQSDLEEQQGENEGQKGGQE